jgi:RND superfamily putative drug exporter
VEARWRTSARKASGSPPGRHDCRHAARGALIALATTEDRPVLGATRPPAPNTVRLSRLYRWGVAVARRRRAVLGISVLVLIVCSAVYPALQRELGAPNTAIKGSDSARVEQLIERLFPLGSETDVVVFDSNGQLAGDRGYRAVIAAVDRAVGEQAGVRSVQGPYDPNAEGQILGGEHVAITLITIGGSADKRIDRTPAMQTAVTRAADEAMGAADGATRAAGPATRAADADSVHVWLTGPSPLLSEYSIAPKSTTEHAESIGLPVALMILVLATGTLVAAMLPLLLAVAGLLLAFGVLAVLAHLFQFDSFLLAIVTLIGLGVGIDYALFVTSRFREELARSSPAGRDEAERVGDAVGVALATSGRTILFSGVIAALSLASLLVLDSDLFREVAVGALVVIACTLVAAMTLLPAVLALVGGRIDRGALPARMQPADARPQTADARAGIPDARPGGWARWALLVMRRPVLAMCTAAVVLLVAAIPVLHLNYGFDLGVFHLSNAPSVEGQNVLSRVLSPGVAGPIEIVVTGHGGKGHAGSAIAAAASLEQELERDQRVTRVAERRGEAGVLLSVIPAVRADSTAATALVKHIRNDLAPAIEAREHATVLVGGPSAETLDGINELGSKFLLIMALILLPSLLFLLVVFRSIALPIKAVLMNLLATGATMGLVVWVFQDGHGQRLLGFTSTGYIQFTVPMVMFALLFGLSMDYEVFLIRRVQEEWRKTGDNTLAVAAGIEHTARSITAAAAIMVTVFGSFMLGDLLEVKQLGFALSVAILLDATLIRLLLVPAVMRLLGRWNWWLPAWLARVLPDLGSD